MALNDPLFSPESQSPPRPWWVHPAVLVLALLLLAGGLAWATSKPPKERPPRQIEIEFDVIYDDEHLDEDMSAD